MNRKWMDFSEAAIALDWPKGDFYAVVRSSGPDLQEFIVRVNQKRMISIQGIKRITNLKK